MARIRFVFIIFYSLNVTKDSFAFEDGQNKNVEVHQNGYQEDECQDEEWRFAPDPSFLLPVCFYVSFHGSILIRFFGFGLYTTIPGPGGEASSSLFFFV
jgi:hypothetical protein